MTKLEGFKISKDISSDFLKAHIDSPGQSQGKKRLNVYSLSAFPASAIHSKKIAFPVSAIQKEWPFRSLSTIILFLRQFFLLCLFILSSCCERKNKILTKKLSKNFLLLNNLDRKMSPFYSMLKRTFYIRSSCWSVWQSVYFLACLANCCDL